MGYNTARREIIGDGKDVKMKAVFIIAVVAAAPLVHARSVTMMTYNVQIGAGLRDPYNFPRGSLGHLPQVAQHINEVKPDWVAIQEIDRNVGRSGYVDQTQELAKMCGMKGIFFPKTMRTPKRFVSPSKATDEDYANGAAYGLAILSKDEPLSVRKVIVPGYYHPRCVAFAEFKDYVVACTHFPLKEEHAMIAAQVALMNAADYRKPVFLAGDFNFEVGSNPIAKLQNEMTILNDTSVNTFPPPNPVKCIDFIMVDNPHTNRVTVTERRVINDPDASDHCAVVVKAELQAL